MWLGAAAGYCLASCSGGQRCPVVTCDAPVQVSTVPPDCSEEDPEASRSPEATPEDDAELLADGNPCQHAAPQAGDFVPAEPTNRYSDVCRANGAAERKLRADLLAKLRWTRKGSRFEVGYGCDLLRRPIQAILFRETPDVRFQSFLIRKEPGGDYSIVHFYQERARRTADGESVTRWVVRRGAIRASQVNTRVGELRAAVAARIREVEPAAGFRGGRGWGSSGYVCRFVQLVDEDWNLAQREFCGRGSSSTQARHVPMDAAVDAVRPLLAQATIPDTQLTREERRFLARWLYENRPNVAARAEWFGRVQRIVDFASLISPRDLVPTLLEAVRFMPNDSYEAKLYDQLLGLLAEVTKWDAHVRADGTRRSRAGTSRAYLRACGELWAVAADDGPLPPLEPADR